MMTYDELKIGQVITQRFNDTRFICIISNKDLYEEDILYNIPTFRVNDDKTIIDFADTFYLSRKDDDSMYHMILYYNPVNKLEIEDKRIILETILMNNRT